MKLNNIDNNGTLQGFVLVKVCDKKVTKTGSTYLDMNIFDGESDIVAKLWDFRGTDDDKPSVNSLILVRGTLNNFNGQPQFKIERWRNINENDEVKMSDYVPSATFDGEYMYNMLLETVDSFSDDELKTLAGAVLDEYRERIIDLPAAYRLHHAVRGGLLMHTLSICKLCEAVCALYPSADRDLLVCGAILHDIAKSEEFNMAPTGLVDSYTSEGMLIGHLVRGAMLVNEIGKKNDISEETLMLVEHMLISHHGIPEYGAAVRPLFLEAELLSELDTLDANVYEIENVLKGIEKGAFSQKVWALDDRRFYSHGRRKIVTDVIFDWNIGKTDEDE